MPGWTSYSKRRGAAPGSAPVVDFLALGAASRDEGAEAYHAVLLVRGREPEGDRPVFFGGFFELEARADLAALREDFATGHLPDRALPHPMADASGEAETCVR